MHTKNQTLTKIKAKLKNFNISIVSKAHINDNEFMSAVASMLVFLKKNTLQIIALAVLFLLLVITWFFFQKKNVFPEGTHIAIQEEFQNIIRNKLLEKNPSAYNIQFHHLWTETTNESSQIRAVFSYSFNDPSDGDEDSQVDVKVEGSALINRRQSSPSSTGEQERWVIGSFKVDKTEMNFNDEVLVLSAPEGNSSEESQTIYLDDLPQGDLSIDSPNIDEQ